jgi:hypothetical protein
MISPDEIAARARRAYATFLRDWLRGLPFAPLSFSAGPLPTDYRTLQKEVELLLAKAKEQRGFGYRVEQQLRVMRAFGAQSLPERISIESAEDLLRLAGKIEEFAAFQADVALIRATLPQLESWLEPNVQRVIAYHGVWPDLLAVCTYFLAHPRPGLYPRELPVAVHTKFIEGHTGILRRLLDALLPSAAIADEEGQFELRYGLRYDEALVRLRLLDPALGLQMGLPLTDISAPVSQIAGLPFGGSDCIIVENKLVFLTLPALTGVIAIFGSGFSVELLSTLPWLHTCRIWYWGDLDAQGFQILAQLRRHFSQAQSLLMDKATLEVFQGFVVPGTPCAFSELPGLTSVEQILFSELATTTLRLEQERISYAYVQEQLRRVLGIGEA